ncbi:MAG: hypothetical protein Q8J78_14715 [Moraxellaceae bacterium]|nr:hypothetical protein [Moraxellaceae bacterium]
MPTVRGRVVGEGGPLRWTAFKPQRNIQEKQSPALPGFETITQVLTQEVLESFRYVMLNSAPLFSLRRQESY